MGGGSGREKRNSTVRKLWKTELKYYGKNAEVWLFTADGLWQGNWMGKDSVIFKRLAAGTGHVWMSIWAAQVIFCVFCVRERMGGQIW